MTFAGTAFVVVVVVVVVLAALIFGMNFGFFWGVCQKTAAKKNGKVHEKKLDRGKDLLWYVCSILFTT
jgi:membrane protein DedA with SNARE-associated domain